MRRTVLLTTIICGIIAAGSAHARNWSNCPIYPLPPAPTAPPEKKTEKAPPRQKSFDETFQQTSSGVAGGAPITKAVVAWQPYFEDARKAAGTNDRPFVLYFCDAETAKVTGEGQEAWEKYKKANGQAPALTIFDSVVPLRAFASAGVIEFFKVPDIADNAPLYRQYEAARGMLVFCAPNGDRLAVFPAANLTQTNLVHFLENGLATYVAEWRKDEKADAERALAEAKAKIDQDTRVAAIRAKKAAESQSKGRSSDAVISKALAAVEGHMAKLQDCKQAGWTVLKAKDKAEVHPIKEAVALLNVLTDVGEESDISDQPPSLLEQMVEAQTRTTAFVGALKSWARAGTPAEGLEEVNSEFKRLDSTCAKLLKKK